MAQIAGPVVFCLQTERLICVDTEYDDSDEN